ncbi:MAG: sigma-70 family RNA polymerase sigma factor [Candidatus Paceibacterota bacterium]
MVRFEKTEPWRELRAQYLRHVEANAPWREVWRLLIGNSWYQTQLERCAQMVVATSGAPQGWVEDAQHNAVILLERQLCVSTDLGLDVKRADEQFIGWIRTIIIRQCRESLRSMRRCKLQTGLTHMDEAAEDPMLSDTRIDVRNALNRIDETERIIIVLHLEGHSLNDIARRFQMTYWQVQYARLQGLERMRFYLEDGYCDPPTTL